MEKEIVIICIEGERIVTEKTFFEKISNSSRQLFTNIVVTFGQFDHSISENNKNKICSFLNSTFSINTKLISNRNKKYVYFVIHDDDKENDKISISQTYEFIKNYLLSTNNKNGIKKPEIFEIFDEGKTFDYFLYYIFNKKLAKNSDDIKTFMDENNFKKNDNNMWKLIYQKYETQKLNGIDKLKETLKCIYKLKTSELKIFEIFKEFFKTEK